MSRVAVKQPGRSAKRVIQSLAAVVVLVSLGSGVVGVSEVLGLTDIIRADVPVNFTTYAQLMSAFGSLVFTLGLVILYYQQTRIQQRQESWMEAQHVPDLFVHWWEINRDTLVFGVSNAGTGLARDVTGTIEIRAEAESDLTVVERVPLDTPDSRPDIVDPEKEGVDQFRGTVSTLSVADSSPNSGTTRSDDPSQMFKSLRDRCDTVRVTVSVEYEYVRRKSASKTVYSWKATLSDVERIEDLFGTFNEAVDSELDIKPKNR